MTMVPVAAPKQFFANGEDKVGLCQFFQPIERETYAVGNCLEISEERVFELRTFSLVLFI